MTTCKKSRGTDWRYPSQVIGGRCDANCDARCDGVFSMVPASQASQHRRRLFFVLRRHFSLSFHVFAQRRNTFPPKNFSEGMKDPWKRLETLVPQWIVAIPVGVFRDVVGTHRHMDAWQKKFFPKRPATPATRRGAPRRRALPPALPDEWGGVRGGAARPGLPRGKTGGRDAWFGTRHALDFTRPIRFLESINMIFSRRRGWRL